MTDLEKRIDTLEEYIKEIATNAKVAAENEVLIVETLKDITWRILDLKKEIESLKN